MNNEQYIDDTLRNVIWPIFSARFMRKEKSGEHYWLNVCDITKFCKKKFTDISRSDAKLYFSRLMTGELTNGNNRPYKASSVYEKFSVCRALAAFIEAGQESYGITRYHSPFLHLGLYEPNTDISIDDIPPSFEIEELLEKSKGSYMYYIIGLAYYGGLRVSEMANLTRRNVNLTSNERLMITIPPSNGAPERSVVLPTDFSHDLAIHINSLPEHKNALFLSKRKTPVAPRDMQRSLVKLGTKWRLCDIRNAAGCRVLAETDSYEKTAKKLGVTTRWISRYNKAAEQLSFTFQDAINDAKC